MVFGLGRGRPVRFDGLEAEGRNLSITTNYIIYSSGSY